MLVVVMAVCFSACSKAGETQSDGYTNEEITQKYDDIVGENNNDKPLGSDASVLGIGFSQVDFTFTSADNTIAFSLDKNSFVKMALGGTFYNYISPGSELVSYDAGYKTARGVSLSDNAKEILTKYGIADEKAVYISPGSTIYYNPIAGKFEGKLTALFASENSLEYKLLGSGDVQKFIYLRPTDSAYMNPNAILEKFSKYTSLVSVDITADKDGHVSEMAFYRFDK